MIHKMVNGEEGIQDREGGYFQTLLFKPMAL